MTIKVMLVDDHELIRIALGKILSDAEGIKVIAEASSGEEALERARREQPHVIILDVDMPGMGGVEATRRLTALPNHPKVIVISVHSQAPYPQRLLEAGALGYLPKGGRAEEVIAAIKSVYKGHPYLSPEVAGSLALAALHGGRKSPLDTLTRREMQVMLMLTQGQSLQVIAKSLNLSPKTVATHRYRIYDKLGVDNDVALTHVALRYGILEGH